MWAGTGKTKQVHLKTKEETFLSHSLLFSALMWFLEKGSAKWQVRLFHILMNLLKKDRKFDLYSPFETEMTNSGISSGCNDWKNWNCLGE